MKKHVINFSIILFLLAVILNACKKKEDRLFQVNQVELLPPSAGKNKLKTSEQYVAILHANLFQKALSANDIFEISQCMESIGDKELAREVIISNFINKGGVIKPSHAELMADINKFIIDTYNRFLVRDPSEAEKTYLRGYIEGNASATDSSKISPEIIYFSFALSDEYMYY